MIVTLVNYWPDFGGMLAWSHAFGYSDRQPFYSEPAIRSAFRAHVREVLSRENSLTGRRYADEPVILAWELANEPRCDGCNPDVVLAWVAEMGAVVRDSAAQLVCCGDEGFFHRAGAGSNHLYSGTHGIDHEAILNTPTVDFGTFHLYPDYEPACNAAEFGGRWIREHLEAAALAGKPSLLEEYGSKAPPADRDAVYQRWLQALQDAGGAGSLIWMLAGRNEAGENYYNDGFTIYSPDEAPSIARGNA